jgi:hypothetical protein
MNNKISRQVVGVRPVNIKWVVVRGDSSALKIQFLENDEETSYDITNWQFSATAFSPKNQIFDDLDVSVDGNEITITASSDITEFWGSGVSTTVAELDFDLEVQVSRDTIWTPIIGTITVVGDVTGGRL